MGGHFFYSTQSQEYKYEVHVHEFYMAMAMRIKTHLGNVLYLSSLQSALSTQSQESQSENRLSLQKHQLVGA